ncbi:MULTISPECIES: hypothetical protein [unclassified Pantoea]|uniref:hypothetical protein n=1 Tax=unclassified Pantoea TaxID=2630326 RepID=UPI00301C418B
MVKLIDEMVGPRFHRQDDVDNVRLHALWYKNGCRDCSDFAYYHPHAIAIKNTLSLPFPSLPFL